MKNCFRGKIEDNTILCMVVALTLLRIHPTFFSDVLSVYLFDGVTLLLIICTCKIRIGRGICCVLSLFLSIVIVKALTGYFDTDALLTLWKFFYYSILYRYFKYQIYQCGKYIYFKRCFIICFWIVFSIAIIQFLDPPLIGKIVYLMFGEQKLRSLWTGNPRVYSTFFNANWFAVFISGITVFFLSEFFRDKDAKRCFLRIIACFVLIIISGSRTGVIAVFIGVVFCLLINRKLKLCIKLSLGIIVVALTVFWIASESSYFATTFNRYIHLQNIFASLGQGNDVESLADSRWGEWNMAISLLMKNPSFGNVMGDLIPHNSYLSLLINFGILGLISSFPFFVGLFFIHTNKRHSRSIRANNISFFVMYGIVMMSGDYLMATQVMAAIIMLLHLSTGANYNYRIGQEYEASFEKQGVLQYENNCFLSSSVSSNQRK